MNGGAYYEYQAVARSLNSREDVDRLAREMAPTYDRLLNRWLPSGRTAAIYEVACGPGILLRYLKTLGYDNLGGSDSSKCQIDLARSAALPVRLADSLEELRAAPAGSWDCLLAIDFIEHLPKDILIEFLSVTHRVLKPGGVLILRAPNGDSPFVGRNLFNDITHVWAYTSVASRALLQMAGFQRIEFADESLASIRRQRWLKVPAMKLAQGILRRLIRWATREEIHCLSPSIYIAAWK